MTDSWRGNQGMNSQHEITRIPSRSKNRRPPSGPWHPSVPPSVPSWEKRFCSSVCSIPWRKLCETKKMMEYCYKNIVDWNDSAGEEALQNAKARFWATINGLPCNISLPDPDMYIDEVDWNCSIDPELVADLERQPSVVDDEEKDGKLSWLGNGWDSNQPIPCTGWGDDLQPPVVDDGKKDGKLSFSNGWDSSILNQPVVCTGWDDPDNVVPPINDSAEPAGGNCHSNAENGNVWDNDGWGSQDGRGYEGNGWDCSGWENRAAADDYSWGNGRENGRGNSWGSGHWQSNAGEPRNLDNRRNGPWGTWNGNGQRREGGGRFGSRHYNTHRFQADDYQMNGGGRNSRGRKRVSFVHERPDINKRPLAPSQWNAMRSCGPVTHHGPTQSDSAWRSWEKPVS
ncbi:uncharacterized protein LOC131250860 [Magnolia sinica]|uniref:uncharacterized protein LOC131250860 n=1 Tax=Magnolia sinica TaxID=86752 RepID=UPI0026581253|nr:uncharacterized protein LOC131250860 [Magnolia sinica]